MKAIKKTLTKVIALALLFQTLLSGALCTTAEASTVSAKGISSAADQIMTTQATQYVWFVKKINGAYYKRQFNRTTGQWVGEWTPA
ncbi:hypothetical protein A7X67_17355 [Clostridium sp. W14A]|nr:hypothetical protein A7X67_17355 [Clostridium sp. W14A]